MIRSLFLALCGPLLAQVGMTQEYNREVLPILSEHCFACHGFDPKARQGALRLDAAESAVVEADSGMPAIVPFHPNESELMRRIEATDENERMPPPNTGKQLSAEQRDVLRKGVVS